MGGTASLQQLEILFGHLFLNVCAQIYIGNEEYVFCGNGAAYPDGGRACDAHVGHRFELRSGIDVGHGNDPTAAVVQLAQDSTGPVGRRHEGHGAVGVRGGQMHLLTGLGQQGGGFSHEKDAAEDNMLGRDVRYAAGQFQRVAGNVAVTHHGVILVVVAHDAESGAEPGFEGGDGGSSVVHGKFP